MLHTASHKICTFFRQLNLESISQHSQNLGEIDFYSISSIKLLTPGGVSPGNEQWSYGEEQIRT